MFFTSNMKVVIAEAPTSTAGSAHPLPARRSGWCCRAHLRPRARRFGVHRDRPPGQRRDRGDIGLAAFRDERRSAAVSAWLRPTMRSPRRSAIAPVPGDDAVGGLERPLAQRHQAMGDAHEVFGDDTARFPKQEVDVGHPPVAVLDRNHRLPAAPPTASRASSKLKQGRGLGRGDCIAAWCEFDPGAPPKAIARSGSAAAAARMESTRAPRTQPAAVLKRSSIT